VNVTYWDTQLPGFGLRVSAKGRKTFVAMYRVKGGKEVMETIATMAELPDIKDARDRARASMLQARQGINPVVKRKAAEAAAAAAIKPFTFADLCERYLREHADRKTRASTAAESRRILNNHAIPRWGSRPAKGVTKSDINDLLDEIASHRRRKRATAKGGAVSESNNALANLKTLFRWSVAMDLIDTDPTAGVLKRGRTGSRDRVLNEDEIKLFWVAADQLGWPFGPLFQLLLLTAQRRDEVGRMACGEIDLDRRLWTIPAKRSKNDKAHHVHLSPPSAEIIKQLPNLGGAPLVFSITGATPVSGFSSAKARVDLFMRTELAKIGRDLEHWTLHDLRRTATTIMAEELKIAPHVVDKILNHTAGTIHGVARIYNRAQYLDERKAALEAWGRYIETLVRGGQTSNVLDFRTAS
jgi:integrase